MKAIIGSRALRGERQNRKARQARKPEGTKKVSQLGGYSPPPQTGGRPFSLYERSNPMVGQEASGNGRGVLSWQWFFEKKVKKKCIFFEILHFFHKFLHFFRNSIFLRPKTRKSLETPKPPRKKVAHFLVTFWPKKCKKVPNFGGPEGGSGGGPKKFIFPKIR